MPSAMLKTWVSCSCFIWWCWLMDDMSPSHSPSKISLVRILKIPRDFCSSAMSASMPSTTCVDDQWLDIVCVERTDDDPWWSIKTWRLRYGDSMIGHVYDLSRRRVIRWNGLSFYTSVDVRGINTGVWMAEPTSLADCSVFGVTKYVSPLTSDTSEDRSSGFDEVSLTNCESTSATRWWNMTLYL